MNTLLGVLSMVTAGFWGVFGESLLRYAPESHWRGNDEMGLGFVVNRGQTWPPARNDIRSIRISSTVRKARISPHHSFPGASFKHPSP